MSARENILARIRTSLGRDRALETAEAAEMRSKLSAHPRGPMPRMDWELLPRFRERCNILSSTVDTVTRLDEVPAAVARYVAELALPQAGVCWPELGRLQWAEVGLTIEGRPANGDDKLGITGSYCAIAETGTLMLLSGTDTHAKTSLLPETHVAVVAQSRILRSIEEAWELLRSERTVLPRQVAFVSGPSRTADIEMTLVLGIHGPYRVHVIVVTEA